MKKILMIATGGTIASRAGANGLTPQMTPDEVLACVPEILSFCSVDSLQLFNIDSTNITPDHWLRLADCIRQNYSAYDGFVICHGTDTMAYTAAMLSYLVQHSPKPSI